MGRPHNKVSEQVSDIDLTALGRLAAQTGSGPGIIDDLPQPELASDVVPTVDGVNGEPTYRDWRPEDTRIVTYAVGNTVYPGKYAETREAAKADCEVLHGRILEANYVQGRAFFRVMKQK